MPQVRTIEQAIALYPDLTAYGFCNARRSLSRHKGMELTFERARWTSDSILRKQVEDCVTWLRASPGPAKRIDKREGTSYGMKHRVERWMRRHKMDREWGYYVPNGAIMVAALCLDFPFQLEDDGGPNAHIGVRRARNTELERFAQFYDEDEWGWRGLDIPPRLWPVYNI